MRRMMPENWDTKQLAIAWSKECSVKGGYLSSTWDVWNKVKLCMFLVKYTKESMVITMKHDH